MDEMTRPQTVTAQYARTDNLQTRRGVWGPGPEGVSPVDVLRTTVLSAQPTRVLEIGCGTGHFARSILDAMPEVDYLATDVSEGMVEATRALGVHARQVSAEALPFTDRSFDVVVAAWMLYHVPDLDQTLREVRRVLRDGGVFAIATNGQQHLGDLLREAGGRPLVTQFMSENAEESLGKHFESVVRRDVETRATFPDHSSAAAYLATFDTNLSAALPHFEGERAYPGHTSILVAR